MTNASTDDTLHSTARRIVARIVLRSVSVNNKFTLHSQIVNIIESLSIRTCRTLKVCKESVDLIETLIFLLQVEVQQPFVSANLCY